MTLAQSSFFRQVIYYSPSKRCQNYVNFNKLLRINKIQKNKFKIQIKFLNFIRQ